MLEKKWYVLLTRPRFEKKVGERLVKNNFECCVPLKKELRIWHDRKKWIEVPIFKSYVFINIEEKYRYRVFDIPGILKYVSIGSEIAVLRSSDIENIRILSTNSDDVDLEFVDYMKGDLIEVLTGDLKGLTGELIEDGKNKKIKVRISALECFATVVIEKSIVHRILN